MPGRMHGWAAESKSSQTYYLARPGPQGERCGRKEHSQIHQKSLQIQLWPESRGGAWMDNTGSVLNHSSHDWM